MLGHFLELSVWSRDVAASVTFWEGLGLRQASVGDTWKHRYAVLSDGRLVLGLHEYEFPSPSLTWVRPGLAAALPELTALGIAFDFAKTGPDEFHEGGFRDPSGQVVTLLEARTWSPSFDTPHPRSALGHFLEYRYPAPDPIATAAFWERLGLLPDPGETGPRAVAGGVTLAPRAGLIGAELAFEHDDPPAAAEALARRGYLYETGTGNSLLLRAPDRLAIRIENPAP
jgi:hypothetical protein